MILLLHARFQGGPLDPQGDFAFDNTWIAELCNFQSQRAGDGDELAESLPELRCRPDTASMDAPFGGQICLILSGKVPKTILFTGIERQVSCRDLSGGSHDSNKEHPVSDAIRRQLEKMVPAEARPWCDVKTRVEVGVPYNTIAAIQKTEKADLLVMNVHGKGLLDRALLGSTAERVIRAALCPVLLIPPVAGRPKRKAVKRKGA